MSKLGKMVKDVVKTKKESVMGKLGDSPYEDPMEPWSVKYNQPVKEDVEQLSELSKEKLSAYKAGVEKKVSDLGKMSDRYITSPGDNGRGIMYAIQRNRAKAQHAKGMERAEKRLAKEDVEDLTEDSILYRYIRSKGYSPEHMDFAHRSAFARSRAFKTYKIMHQKTVEKPQGGISDIIAHKEEVEHIEEVSNAEMYKTSAETSKAKLAAMKAMDATRKYEKERLKPSNISEAGVGKLMNFIKAKGLDPTSMDGNQKKNYSGSSEYRVFKVLHPEDPKKQLLQDKKKKLKETSGMGERGEDWSDSTDEPFIKVTTKSKKLKEEADAVDTVTMDIPLLIRVLEFAREDAKTDMDLHKVVENLIKMRGDGTLSMESYAKIVAIKEHLESLDELSKETLKSYVDKVSTGPSRGKTQTGTLKSIKAIGGVTKAIRKQYEKPITELKKQPDNMDADDHLTREAAGPCWKGYMMVGSKMKGGKSVPNCVPTGRKNIVKSAAKKKISESMYDWEKDDKGGSKKPNAKVVMKGGTTMTGKPRDTVEIEPVLKTRPNSASGGKPGV